MEYEKLKEKVKNLGFRVTKDVKGKRCQRRRRRVSQVSKTKPRVPKSSSRCVKWFSRRLNPRSRRRRDKLSALPQEEWHLHLHLHLHLHQDP
jgi:hypothetical protein